MVSHFLFAVQKASRLILVTLPPGSIADSGERRGGTRIADVDGAVAVERSDANEHKTADIVTLSGLLLLAPSMPPAPIQEAVNSSHLSEV